MSGYTKVFGSIIHSTVWREPNHVRLVWITLLAMKDEDGVVEASVPGLMDAARVTREEVEDALDRLMSPDPDSRNPDNEGRRIAKVDGGWFMLNHQHYKDKASKEERTERKRELGRMRQQNFRDRRNAEVTQSNAPSRPVTENNADAPIRSDHIRLDQIREGSDAPPRDQDQEDKDREAMIPPHPLVALCVELWPEWPQDQIEQSVMAWGSAKLKVTPEILRAAKAYQNPREPYSKIHGCIARQAQFAARDGERDAAHTVGRPQPEYKPTPEEPEETDEEQKARVAERDRIIGESEYGKNRKKAGGGE